MPVYYILPLIFYHLYSTYLYSILSLIFYLLIFYLLIFYLLIFYPLIFDSLLLTVFWTRMIFSSLLVPGFLFQVWDALFSRFSEQK